ncbi:MAG: formimidoylglutamate deiminase [Clostridia bacterium]|nr:formimidoylglutamate deiminase [Deltaproteobacteria bacterium]
MIFTAERMLVDGIIFRNRGLKVDVQGRVQGLTSAESADIDFGRQLLIPGAVNAHSHAFQRLLRGRTQSAGAVIDNFWSWREVMYHVAGHLDPEGIRSASRQAFLEMLLSGITSVGEFHYVHHQPDGALYDDPNATSHAILAAAHDVGIRIRLIRTVYLRGDFDAAPAPRQRRFCDVDLEDACDRIDALGPDVAIAAHSVRGVPLEAIAVLRERYRGRPLHVHAAEQRHEVEQCLKHTGKRPVELLADVLDQDVTLIHATHLVPSEIESITRSKATVCICPSTEADLGDGLGPVGELFNAGVPLALGSDGQTLLSLTEEARRLEMHARLQHEKRNVLTRVSGAESARACFDAMTTSGARALGLNTGALKSGEHADFVTYDLDDPVFAGCDSDEALLGALIFSADSRAVRNVWVGGEPVVRAGNHEEAAAVRADYETLCRHLFA